MLKKVLIAVANLLFCCIMFAGGVWQSHNVLKMLNMNQNSISNTENNKDDIKDDTQGGDIKEDDVPEIQPPIEQTYALTFTEVEQPHPFDSKAFTSGSDTYCVNDDYYKIASSTIKKYDKETRVFKTISVILPVDINFSFTASGFNVVDNKLFYVRSSTPKELYHVEITDNTAHFIKFTIPDTFSTLNNFTLFSNNGKFFCGTYPSTYLLNFNDYTLTEVGLLAQYSSSYSRIFCINGKLYLTNSTRINNTSVFFELDTENYNATRVTIKFNLPDDFYCYEVSDSNIKFFTINDNVYLCYRNLFMLLDKDTMTFNVCSVKGAPICCSFSSVYFFEYENSLYYIHSDLGTITKYRYILISE